MKREQEKENENRTVSINGLDDEGHDMRDNVIVKAERPGMGFLVHVGDLFGVSQEKLVRVSAEALLPQ